jgi:hypothetical protein
MAKNFIVPTFGQDIFNIDAHMIASEDMVPSVLNATEKKNLLQGVHYTFNRIKVRKMEEHPSVKDAILINGEVCYHLALDTKDKLENRFYGSEDEVIEEIIYRSELEMEKLSAVKDFINHQKEMIADLVTNKRFE